MNGASHADNAAYPAPGYDLQALFALTTVRSYSRNELLSAMASH